jgi:hypothetical protein
MNIKLVQLQLNRLGFGPLAVDGTNGPKTEAAIKKFETAKGLPADGKQDKAFLDLLFPPVKIDSKILAVRAMQYELSKEGVTEATGQNDGPEVETFLRAVGLGRGYSWCMAFQYWAVNQAALDLGVKNPLVKTGGVLDQWHRFTGQKFPSSGFTPTAGDIGIIDHGGGNGHTYMVTGTNGLRVFTIEGNTNTDHSRNGNGVYQLDRKITDAVGFIRI